MRRHLARLRGDRRGATIVEFAAVLPVLMLMLLALSDLAFRAYMQSILTGAVQKAGRDSGIQGAATGVIDATVMTQIRNVLPAATYTSARRSYAQFGYIAPEPFVDGNGNGIHDPKECFTDLNGNKVWDADPGSNNQGGASDVTVYTIVVTYQRLFPLGSLLGWPSTQTIAGTTILKNQPYATQNVPIPQTVCP